MSLIHRGCGGTGEKKIVEHEKMLIVCSRCGLRSEHYHGKWIISRAGNGDGPNSDDADRIPTGLTCDPDGDGAFLPAGEESENVEATGLELRAEGIGVLPSKWTEDPKKPGGTACPGNKTKEEEMGKHVDNPEKLAAGAPLRARIRQVREALGLSRPEMCAKLKRAKAYCWYIETRITEGNKSRTDTMIKQFCRGTGVNYAFVRNGAGEMFEPGKNGAIRGNPPLAGVIDEMSIDKLKQEDKPFLCIHFGGYEDLNEFLTNLAREDFRTPEQEILYLLRELKVRDIDTTTLSPRT